MSTEILLIIDKLQKLDSGRLQTLWEWKNRVLLEEYYTFNVVNLLHPIFLSKWDVVGTRN